MQDIKRIISKVADGSMEIGYFRSHKSIENITMDMAALSDSPARLLGVAFEKTYKGFAEDTESTPINTQSDGLTIYVVAIPTAKKWIMANTLKDLALDVENRRQCSERRKELIEDGYECIEIKKGADGTLISLVPERCVIIGAITALETR